MFRSGAVSRGELGSGLAGKASQGNVRCCGASSGVAGKASRGNVWTVCRGMAGEVRSVGAWNVKFRYGRHGMVMQRKVSQAKARQAR